MSKTLRIYGCGGAGVNLVSHYFGKESESGCAQIAPALIDTSKSNLMGRRIDESATYLVEGLDGSGKIRSENYQEINKTIRQVLVQIPPADFNLVVFSTSGGSGSVIGPLIMEQLNQKKIPAMVVVVGSDESTIAAENTLKTIKTLELIAKNTELPVVMSFHKNDVNERRSATDAAVRSVISCMSILTSGMNAEMDYRDLVHWVQYTKVNGGRAQLATMHIATSPEHMARITAPLSVASLYSNPDDEHIATSADYQSVGYADLSHADFDQVHFVIGVNDLARIGQEIKAQVSQMVEARAARVEVDSLLDDDDNAQGSVIL
jgi:cell division GTPase FtsZ